MSTKWTKKLDRSYHHIHVDDDEKCLTLENNIDHNTDKIYWPSKILNEIQCFQFHY